MQFFIFYFWFKEKRNCSRRKVESYVIQYRLQTIQSESSKKITHIFIKKKKKNHTQMIIDPLLSQVRVIRILIKNYVVFFFNSFSLYSVHLVSKVNDTLRNIQGCNHFFHACSMRRSMARIKGHMHALWVEKKTDINHE